MENLQANDAITATAEGITLPLELLRKKGVSLEAAGALALGMAEREDAAERFPAMLKERGIPHARTYRLIRELIAAGCCRREVKRPQKHRLGGYIYRLYPQA